MYMLPKPRDPGLQLISQSGSEMSRDLLKRAHSSTGCAWQGCLRPGDGVGWQHWVACRYLEHAFPVILRRERYLGFKLKAAQDQDKGIHTSAGWNLQNALRRQMSWPMVLGRDYTYQLNAFH